MRDVIEIGTPRLKLRRLRMSDAQRIAQFCDDPGVGRNLAQTPLPYLPVAAEGWIMINAARASRGTDFVYAVELPGEGLIGAIGAHKRGEDGFEMGYWLAAHTGAKALRPRRGQRSSPRPRTSARSMPATSSTTQRPAAC